MPRTATTKACERRLQNTCKKPNEPVRFFGTFRFPPVGISRSFYIRFPKITLQIALGLRREPEEAYNVLRYQRLRTATFRPVWHLTCSSRGRSRLYGHPGFSGSAQRQRGPASL